MSDIMGVGEDLLIPINGDGMGRLAKELCDSLFAIQVQSDWLRVLAPS